MAVGIDASSNCGLRAAEIRSAGIDFVGRYYASHGRKILTPAEARQLGVVGLRLVVVWEDKPTSTEYFSYAKGMDDGTSAYYDAMLLGQPASSAIYFAVDYDASPAAIAGPIGD